MGLAVSQCRWGCGERVPVGACGEAVPVEFAVSWCPVGLALSQCGGGCGELVPGEAVPVGVAVS